VAAYKIRRDRRRRAALYASTLIGIVAIGVGTAVGIIGIAARVL